MVAIKDKYIKQLEGKIVDLDYKYNLQDKEEADLIEFMIQSLELKEEIEKLITLYDKSVELKYNFPNDSDFGAEMRKLIGDEKIYDF